MPTVTYYPIRDAYIRSSTPDTNYEGTDALHVGNTIDSHSQILERTLLWFNIDLEEGQCVDVATLKLNVEIEAVNPSIPARVRRVTKNVVFDFVTWNKYREFSNWTDAGGDYVTDDQASFTLPDATGISEIDVTSLARDAHLNRNGKFLVIVMRKNEKITGNSDDVVYSTDDNPSVGLSPELEIDWDLCVPA